MLKDNRDVDHCQPTTQCIAELSTYSYTLSPKNDAKLAVACCLYRDLERCQPITQCIAELSTYSYTISSGIALS
ncbi:hypothetical protein J6590_087679 [Homalodisca vitripennis]|nr:hypothetical protein J6590_087679 [Homalodisca vitripennis]